MAVVFTKADLFEEWISDPESFARGNVSSLHAQCQARLEKYSFYCSGVAGSSAKLVDDSGRESLIPLRVEPHGIIEPFAWMVSKIG